MENRWARRGCMLQNDIEQTVPRANEVAAWYLGQVGYVFKGEKTTIAVDPFLNDIRGEDGVSCRLYEPPFTGAELCADAILITHGHDDHMALPTLALTGDTPIVVPEGCAEELRSGGIAESRIVPVRAGQTIELAGAEITAVQAAHPVHTENGDFALCYQIRLNGVTLLHLGDTYLTDRLYRDLARLDAPDAFFPPINGGDYFRTARNCIGNLNATEAARLAYDLRARVTVPTHYDMMIGNTVEPYEFVRELRALEPSAEIRLPVPGEKLLLQGSGLSLRRAEFRDLEAVCALYANAVGTAGCTWNGEYPAYEDAYGDLMSGCLYVYTLRGKIIGAASVCPENELDELDCWKTEGPCREIIRVVIANEYRGNGLAADMTLDVIRELRRQGFAGVRLLAAKKNSAACAAYRRLGFRTRGEAEMYGNTYWTMELPL